MEGPRLGRMWIGRHCLAKQAVAQPGVQKKRRFATETQRHREKREGRNRKDLTQRAQRKDTEVAERRSREGKKETPG